MIVLVVLSGFAAAIGVGFQIAMVRRDEPALGMAGLMVLLLAGVPGSVYGTLSSG